MDWLNQNGFGGVELAWVYPQDGAQQGPKWLSDEWARKVAFARRYAGELGLGCDFSFGTSWPFGGSNVSEQDASQIFGGLSPQRLEKSWEWPVEGYLVNHLDHHALEHYAQTLDKALAPASDGAQSGLFCDSWEVLTDQLWTTGFGEAFRARFGYPIEPLMPNLNNLPNERYDYRKLISDYVLNEFYRPFTQIAHKLGSFSRVQCHGAPTDVLAAYAAVDVPESEAILFDPEFSIIPASAAALTGKRVVSSEAFTCMYGWVAKPGPGPHQGEEQVADLKMLADALFANGVNQVFWHGMPYNPPGGHNRFYATTHVGPDAAFAAQLPAFNAYMEQVCDVLKRGVTRSEVAVYMPLEDGWMQNELAPDLRKPSAQYHWEMHYARVPRSLKGYRPLWVSLPFLKKARYEDRVLRSGEATFSALYVNVEWLDHESLAEVMRLAKQGLPICMAQRPQEPGKVKHAAYIEDMSELLTLDNVSTDYGAIAVHPRLVRGTELP
ncbi:MAG TPA: glycosyl hydrolase, partial [Anaerolineae bacterium]